MATSPRRALGRWLEPFADTLWIFFLVLTALVAIVWVFGLGEFELLDWGRRLMNLPAPAPDAPPPDSTVGALLHWIDPVWIVLAAANVYVFTALREGLDVARRWSLFIVVATGLVAGLSAKTGWPLGPVHYTSLIGPRAGPVPLCVPLLWLAIILGARDLVLRLRPAIGQLGLGLGTAGLVLLFDLALEPVAWKFRVLWLWSPLPSWPPVRNYMTWGLIAGLLAYQLREARVAAPALPPRRSPAAVYVLILGVLALTLLARLRT